MNTLKRKLTAILSADVVGYSKLMTDDEEATVHTLKSYRKLIESLIVEHRGRLVDSPGDNLLAEFVSVVDALRCAWDIQNEIQSRNLNLPEKRRMTFRIGINLGDVIEEEGRIYGDGVNVAARLESLADAGGICISGNVYNHVKNKVSFRFGNQGKQYVKNIDEPVHVYSVLMQSEMIQKETEKSIPVNEIPIEHGQKAEESILDSIIDLSVPTDKSSIAVLPFVNMSGDPEQEYFSDGMTEAIITALAKISDILVIARNSTFVFKGKAVDVKQVGKELGVKYVLEGSVQKAGNRIRLTAQLIDATTGNHLWADRYDRDLKDIFELQDEITARILHELGIKLWSGSHAKLAVKGTDNLEAYLKSWQGLEYLLHSTKNDIVISRKMFREVIDLDPDWSAGYAYTGATNLYDYMYGWSKFPDQALQEAVDYSKKAICLDESQPAPYGTLSHVYFLKGRYKEAIAEAEKAIIMQPNYFVGYYTLGLVLVYAGETLEAQDAIKKAIRLSPKFYFSHLYLGITYCDLGQHKESILIFEKLINMLPDHILLHARLTVSYILSGMEDEAYKQAKEVLRIDPNFLVDDFVSIRPYKTQSDTDRVLNALRKAGLK